MAEFESKSLLDRPVEIRRKNFDPLEPLEKFDGTDLSPLVFGPFNNLKPDNRRDSERSLPREPVRRRRIGAQEIDQDCRIQQSGHSRRASRLFRRCSSTHAALSVIP